MYTIRLDRPNEVNRFFGMGITHKDLGQLKSAYIKYPKASFYELEIALVSLVKARMEEAVIDTDREVELVQYIRVGNKELPIKALINRYSHEIKYKGFKKFIKEFLKTNSASRFWYYIEKLQCIFSKETRQDVRECCLILFWSGVPAKLLLEDGILQNRRNHG